MASTVVVDHPKAGQIEGWAFGNGKKPRISPP
jgi:hypothetical protein